MIMIPHRRERPSSRKGSSSDEKTSSDNLSVISNVSDEQDEWADLSDPDFSPSSDAASRPRPRSSFSHRYGRPRSHRSRHAAPDISKLEEATRENTIYPVRRISHQNTTFDGLLRSGDQKEDITVHLNFDGAIDISDDLAYLSRLNRLGHFKIGVAFFEDRLASHVDFFPVVAEYADFLLEQWAFEKAEEFVQGRLDDSSVTYSDEELTLLQLLKCFAMIYTKGALLAALEKVKEMFVDLDESDLHECSTRGPQKLEAMESRASWSKGRPKNMPKHVSQHVIQATELCLRIITFAFTQSSYLGTNHFRTLLNWSVAEGMLISYNYGVGVRVRESRGNIRDMFRVESPKVQTSRELPPFQQTPSASVQEIPQLGPWYRFLVEEGYLWESHRLLKSILSLTADNFGYYRLDGSFEWLFELENLQDAVDKFCGGSYDEHRDEQFFFAEFANATELVHFLDIQGDEHVLNIRDRFAKKAKSMAERLFSDHWELINSRSYLYWLIIDANQRHEANQKRIRNIQKQPIMTETHHTLIRDPTEETVMENTKKPAETDLKPDDRVIVFEVVEASATDLGDYYLKAIALSMLSSFHVYPDHEKAFELAHKLASVYLDEVGNVGAYAACLAYETMLLGPQNSSESANKRRKELYLSLKDFEELHPSRFDLRDGLAFHPGIVFLDSPVVIWDKMQALHQLLLSMNRPTGAQMSISNRSLVERHLPENHYRLPVGIPRCSGCAFCNLESSWDDHLPSFHDPMRTYENESRMPDSQKPSPQFPVQRATSAPATNPPQPKNVPHLDLRPQRQPSPSPEKKERPQDDAARRKEDMLSQNKAGRIGSRLRVVKHPEKERRPASTYPDPPAPRSPNTPPKILEHGSSKKIEVFIPSWVTYEAGAPRL
ncbi:hypothetical protein N7520_006864 [Penicillium odoratum]|uniref:uncharacterized protein n=1 Tax=Penicillium odoratum TaxID=1167516 RepID=UPI002547EC95|nr:uncharacterized protein N7520_006864 [Penicillium odoratum]KAJ5759708.1 hypothetical protein N7520_006864 [Penicillium odoratum]